MGNFTVSATVSAVTAILTVLVMLALTQGIGGSPDTGPPSRAVFALPVSGHAEVNVASNRATAVLGVRTNGVEAVDAITANSELMQDIFAGLEEDGVSLDNVRTRTLRVTTMYSQVTEENPRRVVIGYEAINQIEIIFEDLDSIGRTIDTAFQSGVNEFTSLRYWTTDMERHRAEARALAIADARAQAQIIADASGLELGRLIGMNVGTGQSTPIADDDAEEETFVISSSRIARSDVAVAGGGPQPTNGTVTLTFEFLRPVEEGE